jgi:DNA replicative helicase MCM subunit Mcm2 (Cdc46/Mcm family)
MGILDESEFDELLRKQKDMASRIVQESETDNKIKILTIFDSLVKPKEKKVQKEHLLIEAQVEGLSEKEAVEIIEKLKDDGIFYEPQPGYIAKT